MNAAPDLDSTELGLQPIAALDRCDDSLEPEIALNAGFVRDPDHDAVARLFERRHEPVLVAGIDPVQPEDSTRHRVWTEPADHAIDRRVRRVKEEVGHRRLIGCIPSDVPQGVAILVPAVHEHIPVEGPGVPCPWHV
jgi:hypothetical protein